MSYERLHKILDETTVQLRKGKVVEERKNGSIAVKEIYAMPHESERGDLTHVDCIFLTIGVDPVKATERRDELVSILSKYEQLKAGPSYIAVGAEIGDQAAAFQLFALGQVLGLWKIMTPKEMGFDDPEQIREMAGRGFIMVDGFHP